MDCPQQRVAEVSRNQPENDGFRDWTELVRPTGTEESLGAGA